MRKTVLWSWIVLSAGSCKATRTAISDPMATTGAVDTVVEPASDTTSSAETCLKAQSRLGGFDLDRVKAVAQVTLHNKLDAFIASKPAIKDGQLLLHAFVPDLAERGSEYPQMWCKLESVAAIETQPTLHLTGTSGTPNECNGVGEAFFKEAIENDDALSTAWQQAGYTLRFANTTYKTGEGWAPSMPTVINQGNKEILVTSSSLATPQIVPALGGMYYCKMFAPTAFGQIVRDVAAVNFDRIPFADPSHVDSAEAWGDGLIAGEVSFDGLFWEAFPRKAIVVYPKRLPLKGTYIVSPGGVVPPLAMRALVKKIAARGFVVFIVRYPKDLAIIETVTLRQNSAVNLGVILHARQTEKLSGLPEQLVSFYRTGGKPLRLFGQGLGGAILSEAVFGEANVFDDIVLYGTTSFVDESFRREIHAKRFYSFIGDADGLGLSAADSFNVYRGGLGATQKVGPGRYKNPGGEIFAELVPGYNHFCIVGDMNVGASHQRAKDRDGPPPSSCINGLVKVFAQRGLL